MLRFNKDACSKNGLNAINLAILNGHTECVDSLLKVGVQLWTTVDMPEKAANDDILAHTLEKHLGQELAYLKSLYEKYSLEWPEKFYNVELREKGEDVIAKPLTKKQKRKRREEMLKKMEKLGESYEERLALSLKAFLLGHKEAFLGEEDGDSSDEDDSSKEEEKKEEKEEAQKEERKTW